MAPSSSFFLPSWSDCIEPSESLITWLLAIAVGHILDLLTIKMKIFTLKNRTLPPKKIFDRGQLVDYKDKWDAYYPKSNVRWLAALHYWVFMIGFCAVAYFLIKIVSNS
jgi:hypothetical protein